MKNRLIFWLAFYLFALPVAAQAAVAGSTRQDRLSISGQRIVTGTIEKIANNKITVKTDEGKPHDFTITPSDQADYINQGFRRGDRVILSYNRQNQLIGVYKIIEGIPYNKDLWLTGSTQVKY